MQTGDTVSNHYNFFVLEVDSVVFIGFHGGWLLGEFVFEDDLELEPGVTIFKDFAHGEVFLNVQISQISTVIGNDLNGLELSYWAARDFKVFPVILGLFDLGEHVLEDVIVDFGLVEHQFFEFLNKILGKKQKPLLSRYSQGTVAQVELF